MLFVFAPSAETLIVSDGLSENAVFYFKILVANTVGVVSTSYRQFCKPLNNFTCQYDPYTILSLPDTTDVQAVTVTLTDVYTIVCEFVMGSNAMGCMVVLTSDGQKATFNLTKSETMNFSVISVTFDSCIDRIEAFDVEADGSVGSVAIPGRLRTGSQASCIQMAGNTIGASLNDPQINHSYCCTYVCMYVGCM